MSELKKRIYLLLALIVLIGAVLRLAFIDSVPTLYWDEVSIGYNAYSITETLRDEHGTLLPLTFQGYDDYKFPGQIYLTVPFVKLLGLNNLSTRLPGAIMSILAIPTMFFFTVYLMKKAGVEAAKKRYILGLLAAGMIAISPWHIQFGRAAFEASTALTFALIGFTLLIKEKRSWTLPVGLLLLAFSVYTYRSELIFIPLMLVVTLCMLRRDLFRKKISTFMWLILFVCLVSPIYYNSFFTNAAQRAEQVSIFESTDEKIGSAMRTVVATNTELSGQIFLNYRLIYGATFLENFFPNISPTFLFISGDPNPRHTTAFMGQLYLWELFFVALGLFYATKYERRLILFIVAWIIFATIPAALAYPTPHALRSLNNIPIFSLLTALGLYFGYVKLKKYKNIYFAICSVVVIVFLCQYLYLYYYISPQKNSDAWAAGYPKVIEYINKNNAYNTFVISGKYWNPYMYVLFYKSFDPKKYQERGGIEGFDRYVFGGTSWDTSRHDNAIEDVKGLRRGNTLFILSPEEFEKNKDTLKQIDTLQDSSGKMVFVVAR